MNKVFSLVLGFLAVSCANYGQLNYVTQLPERLKENSGMAVIDSTGVWFIADNGNKDVLYKVDKNGTLLKELKVKDAKNKDWEDLANDKQGNVYIGDFGNNQNKRTGLVIYKVPNPSIEKGEKITAESIRFSYPEQTEFPPKKEQRHFDAEAFFYYKNALYIITKNRAEPFNGRAFIYKVPATKGNYEATLVGSFITCQETSKCRVTAADISPNGQTIALLGYGNLWVFTHFKWDDFSKGKMQTIDLKSKTQLEALSFINNKTLLLSDEKMGPTGRNLYSYTLDLE